MSEYIERGALEAKAVYMHGFGKNKYVPLKAIHDAPAADVVEVVHGRWKLDVNPYSHRWNYKCIACGGWTTDETDYCPNCGARMDGE